MSKTYSSKIKIIIEKRLSEIFFFFLLGAFWCKRLVGATKWTVKYGCIMTFWEKTVDFFDNKLYIYILAFVIIRAILEKISIRKAFVFLTLIILGKMAQLSSNDNYIFIVILLIVAANEIDAVKILVFFAVANFSLFLFTVIAAQRGIIENQIEIGRNRWYLGFNWTTTSVMLFTYFVFLYIVLKKGELNFFEIGTFFSVILWLFFKTNTRFAFLISTAVLLFFTTFRGGLNNSVNNSEGMHKVLMIMPWTLFLIVFIASVKYNSSNLVIYKINSLLSNRLQQCKTALSTYKMLPFGQEVKWIFSTEGTKEVMANYVDTAYLQFLICYGYISVIILLAFCTYLLHRAFEKKIYSLIFVFSAILFFGLTERQLFWVEYNSIMLLTFSNLDSLAVPLKNKKIYKC